MVLSNTTKGKSPYTTNAKYWSKSCGEMTDRKEVYSVIEIARSVIENTRQCYVRMHRA